MRSARSLPPRLHAIARQLSPDGTSVPERRWRSFARSGLPLVDRIPGREGWLRVTFLWRHRGTGAPPTIYTPIADLLRGEATLLPLGEGSIWYRSFDLPERVRALYGFSPHALPGSGAGAPSWPEYFRSLTRDPFHDERLVMDKDPTDPQDRQVIVSVLSLPGAPSSPWTRAVAPGYWRVDRSELRGRHIPGVRPLWSYCPPKARRGAIRYNLILALDGGIYRRAIPTPVIVQNLVRRGRIGPSVLLAVGSPPGSREREFLHNRRFARFLAEELIPHLEGRLRLSFGPDRTVVVGSSLGGLAAAHAALLHPERIGCVVAQSGAFTWSATGRMDGPPTLMQEYRDAPRGSTRFYLSAGSYEGTRFPGTRMSPLTGVRRLRDVLVSKGYPVDYQEFQGGHDYACWAATLGDGIRSVLGDA